jgi:hypothetical protein
MKKRKSRTVATVVRAVYIIIITSSIGRRSVECREDFYNVHDDVVVIGERRADSRMSVYVVPEGQGI